MYGAAYSEGMQQLKKESSNFVLAIPTLKHFDANSLEGNWKSDRCPTGTCTRHTVSANITKYDLASTYLPAFRQAVEQGGALGVMCSYNEGERERLWLMVSCTRVPPPPPPPI
jgi:beta-glucosidase-like glycosyl hydrolase